MGSKGNWIWTNDDVAKATAYVKKEDTQEIDDLITLFHIPKAAFLGACINYAIQHKIEFLRSIVII